MAERGDVGAIRRAQIVEAASRVIARKGFHNATLAEVEAEAGISRGMMTYHFPTKDAMIQGVFDATIDRLRDEATGPSAATAAERIARRIDQVVAESPGDDFLGLHYTFLAQALHRTDYRARFAGVYALLRQMLARDLAALGHPESATKGLAAVMVGAIQGLIAQRHVDPDRFDAAAVRSALAALVAPRPGEPASSGRPALSFRGSDETDQMV